MKYLTFIWIILAIISANAADFKSNDWKTNLEAVIHQYDTTGTVINENGTYTYRYHTQIFKVHPLVSKLGEVAEKAVDQEGPKIDGILLRARLNDGDYRLNQLVMPQVIKEPYWNTFINVYPIEKDKYISVSLSFGTRSDTKFFEAIRDCFHSQWPRFGLYLVIKDNQDLDKIELAHFPLITEEDIVDYNWTSHTIYLTDTAAKRIPDEANLWSKPVVIVVKGKPVYRGAFDNPNVSISYAKPAIVFGISKLNTTIKTDRRYPNFPFKVEPWEALDPRNNESIKQVFRELGKLTEK
ncbi:MAG: hypothetical protein ACE14V_02000 [bacterium]